MEKCPYKKDYCAVLDERDLAYKEIADLKKHIEALEEKLAYWRKKAEEEGEKVSRRNVLITDLRGQIKELKATVKELEKKPTYYANPR